MPGRPAPHPSQGSRTKWVAAATPMGHVGERQVRRANTNDGSQKVTSGAFLGLHYFRVQFCFKNLENFHRHYFGQNSAPLVGSIILRCEIP